MEIRAGRPSAALRKVDGRRGRFAGIAGLPEELEVGLAKDGAQGIVQGGLLLVAPHSQHSTGLQGSVHSRQSRCLVDRTVVRVQQHRGTVVHVQKDGVVLRIPTVRDSHHLAEDDLHARAGEGSPLGGGVASWLRGRGLDLACFCGGEDQEAEPAARSEPVPKSPQRYQATGGSTTDFEAVLMDFGYMDAGAVDRPPGCLGHSGRRHFRDPGRGQGQPRDRRGLLRDEVERHRDLRALRLLP